MRSRVTVNTAFKAVIAGCAAPQAGRDDTWINKRIRELYVGCYALGHCHSVEVWQDGELVGGLYGVSLRRAPSSARACSTRARDASKVALVHLVARLIAGGFELLDTQYVTEHLRRRSARSKSRAAAIAPCSTRRSRARPRISCKLDATKPVKRRGGARDHRRARLRSLRSRGRSAAQSGTRPSAPRASRIPLRSIRATRSR